MPRKLRKQMYLVLAVVKNGEDHENVVRYVSAHDGVEAYEKVKQSRTDVTWVSAFAYTATDLRLMADNVNSVMQ